jgi:hypothetical protein
VALRNRSPRARNIVVHFAWFVQAHACKLDDTVSEEEERLVSLVVRFSLRVRFTQPQTAEHVALYLRTNSCGPRGAEHSFEK